MCQKGIIKVGSAVISDNHCDTVHIPDGSIVTAEAKIVGLALDFIRTCDYKNKLIKTIVPIHFQY